MRRRRRRRRLADLAVATLAALVIAVVVRGAIGVSPSSVVGRSAVVPLAGTPPRSPSPAVTSAPAPVTAVRLPTVLFVGETGALEPRGGSAASFACRAAITLRWQCEVLTRTPGTDLAGRATPAASTRATPSVPGGRPPDYVVVTTATDDTTAEIRGVLDRLPRGLATASIVLVGPITVAGSARIQRLIVNERRLAAEHGAAFIDPVAERWVVAATRARYLNGEQLSSAGIRVVAARLASDLRRTSAAASGGG
jgi:hypothetical protein